jgi:muramidase (phage lysozyme)
MIDSKLKAFLDLVAWSEGTSTHPLTEDNGYDIIVTGVDGHHVFTDYSDHPFATGRVPIVVSRVPLLRSTAAGRYQLLARYWTAYKAMLHLADFGHDAQDAVALQQIRERGAIAHILAGDVTTAIKLCSNIWASFPGNDYGQRGWPVTALLEQYEKSMAA